MAPPLILDPSPYTTFNITPPTGPTAPHPEWSDPSSILLLSIGSFFVAFGLFSHLVRGKYFLPSSVIATFLGIALGPKGLQLLASESTGSEGWSNGSEGAEAREFLLWACRLVLGIQVLSAGLTLPSKWLKDSNNRWSLGTMLGPVMISSWLISALFVWMVTGLNWIESLVVGACLGPTDPVLAGSVIKGHFAERHVDVEVREILLAESGVNDGFGTPFLYLAITLLFASYPPPGPPPHAPSTTYEVITHFLVWVLGYNLLLSWAIGLSLGFIIRYSLVFSRKRGWIDEDSMLVFSVASAVAIVGGVTLIDANQLLSCFTAGVVLGWDEEIQGVMHSKFSEGVDNVLDIVIFTALGSVLPFDIWGLSGSDSPISFSRLCILAALIIAFRRLPAVLAFSHGLRSINGWGKTIFVGHFGPIGIGALYYALEAADKIPDYTDPEPQIFAIVSFIVFVSVIVHGLTIPFFLLSTFAFPDLAPKLLGEHTHVGEDFGREADLGHLRIDEDEEELEVQSRQEEQGGDGRNARRGSGMGTEREPLIAGKK